MRGVVRLTAADPSGDRPAARRHAEGHDLLRLRASFDEASRDVVAHAAARAAEWSSLTTIDAYRLFSLACDVRVTQLVNGVVGAHLVVDRSITEQLGPGWPEWLHL